MTIALAGIASFVGAGGLGVAIYRGITTNNTALMISGSILIAVLALLSDFILGKIEKRLDYRNRAKKAGMESGGCNMYYSRWIWNIFLPEEQYCKNCI